MLLGSSVTSDEPKFHHFTPQAAQAGMQWKHPASPDKKKIKACLSTGEVVTSVF
jgi:hypothetical protein